MNVKIPLRLFAVALAFSFVVLANGSARADTTYSGGYKNSKGAIKSSGSRITIREDGQGNLSGDWDGYNIEGGTRKGDTFHWWHYEKSSGKTWIVDATLSGGTLTLRYDVYQEGVVLLGIPMASATPEYAGEGTFDR